MILKNDSTPPRFTNISILTVLVLLLAYSTHLTYLEIDPRLDEIRRGLVSLEMILSDNYLVPTINGEPYLNKPPLYNWLLALSYKTFGINEFALRMPVIAAIFWFGWLIYHYCSKFISRQAAIISALFFISNGRILIYDSLIGLIDILYSSIVYAGFMMVYHYGKKQQWYKLFIFSYMLVVIGFLMKGLPSLVFQAFLLLVYFISQRKFKILFHKAHFAGIGVMVLLLGGYYFIYFQKANIPAEQFFSRLISESTDRTVVNAGYLKTILYILGFPLAYLYSFAPWTIFLFLLIKKNWLQSLKQDPFIWFNVLLFFCCSFIFWLSPNTIARYMFMLVPLSLTVAAYYYYQVDINVKIKNAIEYTLIGILIILGAGCLSLPFLSFTSHLSGVVIKSLLTATLLVGCGWLAYKNPGLRLSFIILGFVCTRFGFNWFVVEQRGRFTLEQKHEAQKVMALANGRPIYYQRGAKLGNPDGLSFNIALVQKRILPFADSIKPGAVYVTDSMRMVKYPHKVIYRWASEFQPNHYLVEYFPADSNKIVPDSK